MLLFIRLIFLIEEFFPQVGESGYSKCALQDGYRDSHSMIL